VLFRITDDLADGHLSCWNLVGISPVNVNDAMLVPSWVQSKKKGPLNEAELATSRLVVRFHRSEVTPEQLLK
jgi:hypothetical protein